MDKDIPIRPTYDTNIALKLTRKYYKKKTKGLFFAKSAFGYEVWEKKQKIFKEWEKTF